MQKLSSPADILKICSSLVARIGNDTVTVQLAHASVQKYGLEKKRTIQLNIVIDPSIGLANVVWFIYFIQCSMVWIY